MFVNIIQFAKVKPGKDKEFRDWFYWTNEKYGKYKGFISRRLLQPRDGGNYTVLMEHESYETFWVSHTSPDHAEARQRMLTLIDGDAKPTFYNVVAGDPPSAEQLITDLP